MESDPDLKQQIRSEIRTALDGISRENLKSDSESILRIFTDSEMYRQNSIFACYVADAHEVETADLIRKILSEGKTVVLPRVENRELVFYKIRDIETDLMPGYKGIQEPDPERCRRIGIDEIQVLIAPGVGFTSDGIRLGRGKGFYDRVSVAPGFKACKVCLCFREQMNDAIPCEPHDMQADILISPEEINIINQNFEHYGIKK